MTESLPYSAVGGQVPCAVHTWYKSCMHQETMAIHLFYSCLDRCIQDVDDEYYNIGSIREFAHTSHDPLVVSLPGLEGT